MLVILTDQLMPNSDIPGGLTSLTGSPSSRTSASAFIKMDRERVLTALNATTNPEDQKQATAYLDQGTTGGVVMELLLSVATAPSPILSSPGVPAGKSAGGSRSRSLTTSGGDPTDSWERLYSLTADPNLPIETMEENRKRIKGLMMRWKSAALRARKLLRDPWTDFNINQLPLIRAQRHRYSAIRKTWTIDVVEVKLLGDSFARGAMRECFRLKKLSSMSRSNDWAHASNYVAKRYIQEVDREVLFGDVRLQMDAKLWAEEFNRHSPPKKIDIVQMCVLEMLDMPGQPLYHLEHYIEGDYVKYNSNSGFVSELQRKTPQAFSHFTFERSGHQLIVVDVQGVGDLYTDPQVHTIAGTDYGDGNLGTKGMALFFHSHECNDICHSLCLTEFDLSDKERQALADGTVVTRGEATRFVRPASVCEALPSVDSDGDAMECLRRRTLSVLSNSSGGSRGESSASGGGSSPASREASVKRERVKVKEPHDEDCVCAECLAEVTSGVVLNDDDDSGEEDDEEDEVYGKEDEEENGGGRARKVGFATLAVERRERERYDSVGSSYGSYGESSSRLTRDTEREEYWQSQRKQSMPAGVLSAIEMELLQDEAGRARVTHRASVLGQIHLDLARYHELGRFLPEEDNSEKRVALGQSTESDGKKEAEPGTVNYDRESALYHLDVARRCGVLEAIVTIAQMAYGIPHELLKDVGEDEGWHELDEDGNPKVVDKEAFAFELMETAAEMGDRAAMLFVAEAFETGRRMGKERRTSYPSAIEWFQKAMGFDEGDDEGSYRPKYDILARMAEMYKEGGYGLEQDYTRAYELYTEAAECQTAAGFGPELLRIVVDTTVPDSVKQAGVIYLKNMMCKYWEKDEDLPDVPQFEVSPEDKHFIRENIIDAVVGAPIEAVRIQLLSATQTIARTDFGEKWPSFSPKIASLLSTDNSAAWLGALGVLHKVSKIYEYKQAKDRVTQNELMTPVLPVLLQRFQQLNASQDDAAATLQKLMLKIVYCLTQFALNLAVIVPEQIDAWLTQSREILLRPMPPSVDAIEDPELREMNVHWKLRKWAAKWIERIFERYGAPGQVESGYAEFAAHFLTAHAVPCIEAVLQLLAHRQSGTFVSNRVTHLGLSFLTTGVSHAAAWKAIKPHFMEIVPHVIFPLLCHTAEDEELWDEDVGEYIRYKYDLFEDLHNPTSSAGGLLAAGCKRKDVVQPVLAFIIQTLTQRSSEPIAVDGALHMAGDLATQLVTSKKYKKDCEKLLDAHVIPRLKHESRFVRARAAWCLKTFTGTVFNTPRILKSVCDGLVERLIDANEELPVKVEAAIAIQYLLDEQADKVLEQFKPHVAQMIPAVLQLISKTQVEELCNVVDELIDNFLEDIIPVAASIAAELSAMFLHVIQEPDADDRTPTLMSVISTLSNILDVVDEQKDIMIAVEGSVLQVVKAIFATCNIEYYDDALMLIQSLCTTHVSMAMWEVFLDVYNVFRSANNQSILYSDVMPCVHLYITTDTEAFLARPERLNIVLDMCKMVMEDNQQGDENQLAAAKTMEILLLQCGNSIREAVPVLLMLTLHRLAGPFEGLSELQPMCVCILVAALHTNLEVTVETLKKLAPSAASPMDFIGEQLMLLVRNFDGVHDRKMALLGWIHLLKMDAALRPGIVAYQPKKILEGCIDLFEGLQKAMKLQAEYQDEDSDDEDEEDDEDDDDVAEMEEAAPATHSGAKAKKKGRGKHRKISEDLRDSEDEIDEGTLEYLENLRKVAHTGAGDSDSDDDDDDDQPGFIEETETEGFDTPMDREDAPDIFVLFKQTMESFERAEPTLFSAMVNTLDETQAEKLRALITECDRHASLENSRQLESAGGYQFNLAAPVPTSFNFGGAPQ